MQALLSFDQSPPLAAPLRFFLTAPLFAIAAGVLLLIAGPDAIASRWTPVALALTHLIAAGFMLQVMLGATLQIMPVVAGANMRRPLRVAVRVHATLSAGTVLLVAAFLTYWPPLFIVAALLLGGGVLDFLLAALVAFRGLNTSSPTIAGIGQALGGLAATLLLGVLMSVALGASLDLPLLELADLHLGWGFAAWATVLLAAVAYVVVPMFQLTPAYPEWFARWFARALLAATAAWTLAALAGLGGVAKAAVGAMLGLCALFCALTLALGRRSKRARLDATQRLWRVAMLSALAACVLWAAALFVPEFDEWPQRALLCGVLVLFGAFMSVIVGMLYKIVPFLIWLHLQNRGQGRVAAPNMKKIITERDMDRQSAAHLVACALALLAAWQPEIFVYPAALALLVANGWLLSNLLAACAVYRAHRHEIEGVLGKTR